MSVTALSAGGCVLVFVMTCAAADDPAADRGEEFAYSWDRASLCEVTHAIAIELKIRVESDARVWRDITYHSPVKLPHSEFRDESRRMLMANGLDLLEWGEGRYVVVPLGVRRPRAPEDPCRPSERRIKVELRRRVRLWKRHHNDQQPPGSARD